MSNTNILLILSGAILGIAVKYVFIIIYSEYERIGEIVKNNRQFKELERKRVKFKEEGNLHKWISIPIKADDGSIQEASVCEITGYTPSNGGYLPLYVIEQAKASKENAKKYEEFKEKAKKEIKSKYNLSDEQFEDISNELFSIKQNFHVKMMEDLIFELKGE